jgi:hypothetical protein
MKSETDTSILRWAMDQDSTILPTAQTIRSLSANEQADRFARDGAALQKWMNGPKQLWRRALLDRAAQVIGHVCARSGGRRVGEKEIGGKN